MVLTHNDTVALEMETVDGFRDGQEEDTTAQHLGHKLG